MHPEKLTPQQDRQIYRTEDCISGADLYYVRPSLHSNYAVSMHLRVKPYPSGERAALDRIEQF